MLLYCLVTQVKSESEQTTTHRPEGEDTQLLHDVKFPGLVEVEDIWEQAGVPVKVKLLLLHIIVIAHL